MIFFEYLAIAFSLVFSFSGMRLVGGLPYAVQQDRRYWIHLGLVCFQLLATLMIFWTFWSYRSAEWSFPTFLLVMASPGFVYYNACTLVPENPSAVESWHDYYYSVRRRYFVGVSCWVVVDATISTIIQEVPLVHPARAFQAALLAACIVGAGSASERVHAGLMLFLPLLILLVMLTRPLWIGPFAAS